jgi:regulatory protein
MLRQLRINDQIINEELDKIDPDLYSKILRDLLVSKMKSVKGASDYERKGKLVNYAQSHGFESDIAYRIANELIGG